jgi:hypothetical protein
VHSLFLLVTTRKTLAQLKINHPGSHERLFTYNLDDHEPLSPELPPTAVLPSKSIAASFVDVYFSTVHAAYPFLDRDTFESFLPRLWEGEVGLTDTWKATICISSDMRGFNIVVLVFAWGAAYMSMSDDGTDGMDHTMYYFQARRYLGDFINTSLANLDRVSCLFLASLYFLMIHRPYRFAIRNSG